ncbi:hypothetical protein [Burkholderia perseverans]|uniref:hypothetical protein n=1 Tax=Burkholderia perseverans TaxID=2615214 RepID=UPI001FF02833|nr:hypothetical protein [Burkholderia perseverans]
MDGPHAAGRAGAERGQVSRHARRGGDQRARARADRGGAPGACAGDSWAIRGRILAHLDAHEREVIVHTAARLVRAATGTAA